MQGNSLTMWPALDKHGYHAVGAVARSLGMVGGPAIVELTIFSSNGGQPIETVRATAPSGEYGTALAKASSKLGNEYVPAVLHSYGWTDVEIPQTMPLGGES